jgi:MFS transporter, ACS family, hexuronate transporter
MNHLAPRSVPPVSPPPTPVEPPIRGLRWYICGLLFLVTLINYIDRVSVAAIWSDVLAPALHAGDADYAWLQFWFSLAYAAMFVFSGRLVDRFGVRITLAAGVAVWSLAAMSHALASSLVGFAVARFVLGLGESTNFPAPIKAVAEWFPRRERSLATGIFNMGTNVGAMLIGAIAFMADRVGWQSVFIASGLLGFAWLVPWLRFYRPVEEHPRLSPEEAALIRSDQEPPVAAQHVPWPSLLRYREAWAFCLGKLLTDPVWWFYLFWAIPIYLKRHQHVDLKTAAFALAAIYLCADVGSVVGGWLPLRLQRAGWTPSRARRTTMLIFACFMPVALLLEGVHSPTAAVVILAIATAGHQGWSANLFTIASDAFPRRVVGSLVGLGAMCGGIGGMYMPLIAGAVLQWQGHFGALFALCAFLHPLAFVLMRLLTGRVLDRVDLDRGLRTAFSPRLLAGGLVVTALGTIAVSAAGSRWVALVRVLDGDRAAAAGVITVAAMLALTGLALVYASRAQKAAGTAR